MIQWYPHQVQALNETNNKTHVAYYMDMGLGKTFVGAEKMVRLGNRLNILVCQKSLISTWIQHFETYYPQYEVIDMTVNKSSQYYLENKDRIDRCILIVNYELIFRRKFFLQLEGFTLMLDESSMIQNESAKRSKFILKLKPDNVILLSGTPTAGKYENLWSQLHLLKWRISKKLYWKQYIETEYIEANGFPIKTVTGYKNVDRLKMKLHQHGAVFMKSEEVFDLPDMIHQNIILSSTKEYRKFMRTSIITMDTSNLCEFKDDSDFYGVDMTPRVELIGETVLTKRLYSRMLCGHFNKEKLDALKDLFTSTEDRLIVFYNFNEELAAIKKLIGDRPISIVNGKVKDLSAYEQHDNSITLVQYQAGAMGLNLQKANKIIYFTLPERSELFEQSKKRIHRIGQTKRCFYYYLITRNSVEEDVLETLKMRKDYTDELFKAFEQKH